MIYDKLEPTAPDVPPILDSQREESSNKSLQGLDKDRLPSSNFCFIAEIKGDVRDNEYVVTHHIKTSYIKQKHKTAEISILCEKVKTVNFGPIYFIWFSFYQCKHYLHFLLAFHIFFGILKKHN